MPAWYYALGFLAFGLNTVAVAISIHKKNYALAAFNGGIALWVIHLVATH